MWVYEQRTGEISQHDAFGNSAHVAIGYSGADELKNDPFSQDVPDKGPIPCGIYTLNPPIDTVTHGPYVIPLVPDPDNQMFGRSGFLIHGDSIVHPGTASKGCIIAAHWVRVKMWESKDRQLQVVSGLD